MVGPFGLYLCRLIKSRYKIIISVCYYYVDNDNMFLAPRYTWCVYIIHTINGFRMGFVRRVDSKEKCTTATYPTPTAEATVRPFRC